LTNATGLPLTTGTSGTLPISKGGTNLTTTPTNGQLLIGNGTNYSLNTLTAGSNVTITNASGAITIAASGGGGGSGTVNAGTTNQLSYYAADGNAVSGLTTANSSVLVTNSSGVPSLSTTLPTGLSLGTPASATLTNATGLPLTTGTTGTLTVAKGGTGITTTPTNGQLLIGGSTGYTAANLTAGSNVTITNTDGGITIASTGGGGGGSVTLNADTGSVTGSSLTISGLPSGLETSATGTTISIKGLLSVPYGGTGVTSYPLPASATPIDDTTIISSYYQDGIIFNTTATNQKAVTPLYTISGTSYFAISGKPNLLIYSFNGTSTTLVQTIYSGSNGYTFYGAQQYVISGVNYLAVIFVRNTSPNSSILQVYSWSGSAYVQVGTDILYAASGFTAIQYFVITGTSYVAITDSSNNRILLFSWTGSAYTLSSTIATQSASSADTLVAYTILSTNYLTVSDAFKGISTYAWNGSTFVQVSAQTIADAQFRNLSFFTSGSGYYLVGTTSNYIQIFQWDGVSSYTGIQTISNAGQYGYGITTFTIDALSYMSLTKNISGTYYIDTYVFNSTTFDFVGSQLLTGNLGLGLVNSIYNLKNYLLTSSASGAFYIYQLTTTPVLEIGVAKTFNGGTGLVATPTAGQLLIGNDNGYTLGTLTAGNNITVTNASGSISLASSSSIASNSGTATGSTVTISGGSTGLTTTATGSTVTLSGTLGVGYGGTALTATPTNGQLMIGNGTNYTLSTLTAGSNVTITNASGAITLASTMYYTWANSTPFATLANNSGYITNNGATLQLYALPVTAAVGSVYSIAGKSAGKWNISQNAGQNIIYNGTSSTVGGSGALSANNQYDCVELLCITANTTFLVISSVGSLILV
jgi:hypothetical protein